MEYAGEIILNLEKITKSFDGIKVLDQVNFDLKKGEIHGLLGKNGAGKSTLVKIMKGVHREDEGRILLRGIPYHPWSLIDSKQLKISMVFQELSLIPELTVAQNIFLGHEPRRGWLLKKTEINRATKELLEKYSISIRSDAFIKNLDVGCRQLTEIAKVLSHESKIIILDEPTVSLTRHEVENLFAVLRQLKKKEISIIYISHDIREVLEICDRISILRNGLNIGTLNSTEIKNEQEIIELMTGKKYSQFEENNNEWKKNTNFDKAQVILEGRNICWADRLHNVNFQLFKNEVLGIAGLTGSGRTEIVELLFGINKLENGEILLNGRPITVSSPKDALQKGIILIPENRKEKGLHLMHSVKNNIVLPIIDKLRKFVFLDLPRLDSLAKKQVDYLSIIASSLKQQVEFLSGGNQQKVLIAKWLTTEPKILILDEPFAGVDVESKAEIKGFIRHLAHQGVGVILISSDIRDLYETSDRFLIIYKGKILRTLGKEAISDEETLHHAIQQ
ncbi:MAG: sugar ABC transporter ATP-binding protein [Actinobacteria bacterium]|nr:sugar ABC transporter ATP-binding protein [Actinomycetota bacterium]